MLWFIFPWLCGLTVWFFFVLINICTCTNHIQQYYAGCSMNSKSHFNIIKVPGSVPGKGLEIWIIRVSLELIQAIHTCHTQISRWSEPPSENSSAWLSLQEPTKRRVEVSPTQLKWCVYIPWQDFSFPFGVLLWQATGTAAQSHPAGNRMRLGTFLLRVKVLYECEKLWSDTYATKPVERSMAKIKYLNLKDLICLDCLYLILLKIDQYGTDGLEGWKKRYTLSKPKWDINWSLCSSSGQITLEPDWNYRVLSLYVEGLLSFQDKKKKISSK